MLRGPTKETRKKQQMLTERKAVISKELEPVQEFLKKYNANIAEQRALVEKVESQLKKVSGSIIGGITIVINVFFLS